MALEQRVQGQNQKARICNENEYFIMFYLKVNYRPPSKERIFLDDNWVHRDVRGPYLGGLLGRICIDGSILASKFPSTISLVLSVSNRCPITSILIKVVTPREKVVKHIAKNGSSEFVFTSIYSGLEERLVLAVEIPQTESVIDQKQFLDILAIDELTIERFYNNS